MSERIASIPHGEYEILALILDEIDLSRLKARMCDDKTSRDRFDKAANSVAVLIENMMGRRTHRLPKDHIEYKEKEA
tara:strand:- start:287 stop:517 length:231 start_codon:yes stop_codon:yes gene_type:complete